MIEYVEVLDEKTIAVYRSAAPNNGVMNRETILKRDSCYSAGVTALR